jgi:hypothetical protein
MAVQQHAGRLRMAQQRPGFATFVEGACVLIDGKRACHAARKAAQRDGKAAFVALNIHRPGYVLGDRWGA